MVIIRLLGEALLIFLQIYYFIIFGRIIMSWFMAGGSDNPALAAIYQFVYGVTEPFLAPIRSVVPSIKMGMGYLDLSPIILLILVRILREIVYHNIYS